MARPTEPRNSYASGLGTPHSSPATKNDPYSGSHPVIDRQSQTRKIKGRGVRLHAMETKCSGLSGRRKTHAHPTETVPTELGVALGRSRAFSSVPTFNEDHLGFRRRRRWEDLRLKGCDLATAKSAARVSAQLSASAARPRDWSRSSTTRSSSDRCRCASACAAAASARAAAASALRSVQSNWRSATSAPC